MKFSKPSILISLVLALMLAFCLVGCATAPLSKAELSDSDVRKPPGDPTKFWDNFDWDDMTKAEQALWGVLGWDAESWAGDAKQPASEDKYWNQLNDKEKDACKGLGYNKRLWDNS